MTRKFIFIVTWILFFVPRAGLGQQMPDVFYGGHIGFGAGDIKYLEIAPMVGIRFNPQLSAGISAVYRWREDTRLDPAVETRDYGASVFTRFHVTPSAYLQAEYEYLNYKFYFPGPDIVERRRFYSALAGGGISQPIGRNTYTYATVLYNFDYNQEDSPYDRPWIYRFGVSVGF